MNSLKLAILPGSKSKKISDNQIIITQKFLDGVLEYQKYWPGSIIVFLEEDLSISDHLDNILIDTKDLSFQIIVENFETLQENEKFREASIVLACVCDRQNHISRICKLNQIFCIYITENSLKTRIQVINSIAKNIVVKIRKYIWEISQELNQRYSIALADGIQCNGTPTYEAYQTINPRPLLYFDSRITEQMLINETELAQRTSKCAEHSPLNLLFSGRLVQIKGADHLILVAKQLKKLGVEFKFFICGDGNLKGLIQEQIQDGQLSDSVKILGSLDFKSQLIPFVKNNIDLFVCCHRQGDPSCTYLETMSCGVPIVGYANEAFSGVVKYAQAGWLVPMNRPDSLAQKILELDKHREKIVSESYKSLAFSKLHTFEKTFERRIEHLKKIVFDRPL
jgi:colanic acid/amylovoran biosynthesis glycosyltransferase